MFLFQERINRNRCNTKAAHMWNQPLKWVIDFLLAHSSTCFSWKICVWREAERPQADRNLSPHGRRHHSDLSETSNKWFIEVPWTLSVTSWLEKVVLVNGLWIYVILTFKNCGKYFIYRNGAARPSLLRGAHLYKNTLLAGIGKSIKCSNLVWGCEREFKKFAGSFHVHSSEGLADQS